MWLEELYECLVGRIVLANPSVVSPTWRIAHVARECASDDFTIFLLMRERPSLVFVEDYTFSKSECYTWNHFPVRVNCAQRESIVLLLRGGDYSLSFVEVMLTPNMEYFPLVNDLKIYLSQISRERALCCTEGRKISSPLREYCKTWLRKKSIRLFVASEPSFCSYSTFFIKALNWLKFRIHLEHGFIMLMLIQNR